MLALVHFVILGLILAFSHGHYHPLLIFTLLASQAVFAYATFRGSSGSMNPSELLVESPETARGTQRAAATAFTSRAVLALAVVVFCTLLAASSQLIYARAVPNWGSLLRTLLTSSAMCAVFVFALHLLGRAKWALVPISLALTLALALSRVAVLYVSPNPAIDVWTICVEAVNHFLQGGNPYFKTDYQDIYAGRFGYTPAFPYWPSYLLWATGFAKVFGGQHDVRVSIVAAELLSVAAIAFWLRRHRVSWADTLLAANLWLSFPISLFVTEQSWIDAVLLMFSLTAILLYDRGRFIESAVVMGLGCATKQYGMAIGLFLFIQIGRTHSWVKAIQYASIAALTWLLLVVPFAIGDVPRFMQSTIEGWATALPRPDAMTLQAAYAEWMGAAQPEAMAKVVTPFLFFAMLGVSGTIAAFARWKAPPLNLLFFSIAAGFGWLFLFAKQAFCNYYYFVAFWVFAGIITSLKDHWAEKGTA